LIPAVGLVRNCEKAAAFCARLFQAGVKIVKKMLPEATLIDFHTCGSFHKPPFRTFLSLQKFGAVHEECRARIVYGR